MAQTITLTQSTYKEIMDRISRLELVVSKLLKRESIEPPYGSEAWWDWSLKQSKEDYKKGHYIRLKSEKELIHYLDSLK